jgi:hypothetical protein
VVAYVRVEVSGEEATMTYFAVIINVGDGLSGNYACGNILINPDAEDHVVGSNIIVDPPFDFIEERFQNAVTRERNAPIDLNKTQMVFCNVPVFSLGEILVMGSNDRTIPDGRKPDKWDVEYETFNNIGDAIKRANEVYNHG